MSDSLLPDASANPMQAWLRASSLSRSLLSSLCALSERLASAKLSLDLNGSLQLDIEAPRRARLPKAEFDLTDPEGPERARGALGASESDAEGLRLCAQALLALVEPLRPSLLAFMLSSGCDRLSIGRSLALDPNLPGGVARHGVEAQDALEDAFEDPAIRESALALARLLIKPEHPLSQMIGVFISEADSVEIAGVIDQPPSIGPSEATLELASVRLFSKARSRSL